MTRLALRAITTLAVVAACLLMEACSHPTVEPAGPYPKPLADFNYKMLLAIDQKKIYPWQAVVNHIGGAAMVSFDYIDGGHTTNVHIDKSSGSDYLDRAALQAVANAEMPPKPSELNGVNHFLVRVAFIYH